MTTRRIETPLFCVVGAVCLLTSCSPEPADRGGLENHAQNTYAYKHGPPPGSPPYDYFLTSYGGSSDPADGGTPACGGKLVDGSWYYATGAYTFGCNTKLLLRANDRCVVVKVVDNGPAAWVETKAQQKCGGLGYIIDASPLVSKHLFQTTSAGWSDCFAIHVTPVESTAATGPTACPSEGPAPDAEAGRDGTGHTDSGPLPVSNQFIGQPCTSAASCSSGQCRGDAEQGYPNGMCTASCDRLCPDQPGQPTTFCITGEDNEGMCVSRCDESYYAGGCRPGYACVKLPRTGQPSVKRNVCVPEGKYDMIGERPDAEGNLPNPEDEARGGCAVSPVAAPDWRGVILLVLGGFFLGALASRSRD